MEHLLCSIYVCDLARNVNGSVLFMCRLQVYLSWDIDVVIKFIMLQLIMI